MATSKPIICLFKAIHQFQFDRIKELAPQYELINCVTSVPEDLDTDAIEIIIGYNRDIVNRILVSEKSRLKWIQAVTAGIDTYDLETINKRGILFSNASGIHKESTAEHVLAILLSEYRGIREAVQDQLNSHWRKITTFGELSGKKILIVGTGQIGERLAELCKAFEMEVYGVNTSGRQISGFVQCVSQKNITSILGQMDIVVNILPLTPDTHHFYNAALFASMKDGVFFVNVGRGPSVDINSLIDAVKQGKIGFAGLDVFESEPLSSDSPLWSLSNVLVTPHNAGKVRNYKNKLFQIVEPNLISFLKNGTLVKNQIDFNKGY
ncbi:hypothetical protein CYY_003582 [Polysphondylium violaceum]|uniref:D-isomer specific 2-hydroxyacid dehydrogenase NAD-binding domain-containing protein n=1 Tax=Polysphondylium violaceum TaxID=133409 RepID=A0A8J4V039_9MYCE|nr:hypothetical protein CYY_003582 [Polysphondylium violaceum]